MWVKSLVYALEEQACFRVDLEEEKNDSLLTEAFDNPKLLSQEVNYIADNYHLAVELDALQGKLDGQKAILIRRVLHKAMIAWILVVLLLISPGLGTVIGIYSHRLDIGVAVSAGMFALVSFLLALAKWFL